MSVTLSELALRANLSKRAVAYALNGTGRISDKTRQRVRTLADELSYRVNTAARSTRTGRFGAVGLLLSSREGRSQLPGRMLAGIHQALIERDLILNLVLLPDEQLCDRGVVPRLLREKACDGLLVDFILGVPPRMTDLIDEYRVPTVYINSRREVDAVYPDDRSAGRDATKKLLDAGHTRIAYVSHDIGHETPHYSVLDRQAGYESAMLYAGCKPLVSTRREYKYQFEETFAGWLRQEDRPTAVVAYSPSLVAPVLIVAGQMGLRFPEDLSVVTFAAEPYGLARNINTFITPEEQMGRRAVEMLISRIDRGEHTPAEALPFTYQPGQSVARPPD